MTGNLLHEACKWPILPVLSVFRLPYLALPGCSVLAEAPLPLGSLLRLPWAPRPPVLIPVIVPLTLTPTLTLTTAYM